MSDEEILAGLKLLNYTTESKSLKSCMKQILEQEKYKNIMRGIVTDKKEYEQLQIIIETFNKLKEIGQGKINEILNDNNKTYENDEQTETPLSDIEFTIYYYNNMYHVVRKIDSEYVETIVYGKEDYIINTFIFKVNDGVYNFYGEKVNNYFRGVSGYGKYIKELNTIYHDLNLNKHIDIQKLPDFNSISYILNHLEKEELKEKFLNYIFNNRKLPYLKYEIAGVKNNYLYCLLGNEVCIYDLDGNLIITSEDLEYSFIDNFSEAKTDDESVVIIVGKLNNIFDTLYGYYDVDNRKLICDTKYRQINKWAGYCGCADDEIVSKNKIVKNTLYLEDYFGKLNSVVISEVNHICDNNYLVIDKYNNRKYTMIIKDLTTNPNITVYSISTYVRYDEIMGFLLIPDHDDIEYASINNDYFKMLKIKDIIDEAIYCPDEQIEDKKLLQIGNSEFLLPQYKNDYKRLTAKEKNELMLVSNCPVVVNEKKNMLALYKEPIINNIDKKIENDDIEEYYTNCYIQNNYERTYEYINERCIRFEFRDKEDKSHIGVYNFNTRQFIREDEFNIEWFDEHENILIKIKYGNGFKYYLLDRECNIILGPVDYIEYPNYEIYIVTNKGSMQCFKNGLPLTYKADKIYWTDKYILNGNQISSVEKKLVIENNKNLCIADSEGDKLLLTDNKIDDIFNLYISLEEDPLIELEDDESIKIKKLKSI